MNDWIQSDWYKIWTDLAKRDYLGKPDNLEPLTYNIKIDYGEEEEKKNKKD